MTQTTKKTGLCAWLRASYNEAQAAQAEAEKLQNSDVRVTLQHASRNAEAWLNARDRYGVSPVMTAHYRRMHEAFKAEYGF